MRFRPFLLMLGMPFAFNCGAAPESAKEFVTVKVMTRNVYLGSDLSTVALAPSPDVLPGRVTDLMDAIKKSDFPARAQLIADEIVAYGPDLVGLQEVELFRTQSPGDAALAGPIVTNATDVFQDFLKILMEALATRGAAYQVAVVGEYTDVELPSVQMGKPAEDVRMTDRDVVLVKQGLTFANARTEIFKTKIPLPVATSTSLLLSMKRGVTLLDATIGGARFVFANTHLEVGTGPARNFQESQAQDLNKLFDPIMGPVVLVGDFNSSPGGPNLADNTNSYKYVSEKFKDAWPTVRGAESGHTCCTRDAKTETFLAMSRMDIVWHRGGVMATDIQIVGTDPAKKTVSGQWPSYHAGVVATLKIPKN